MCNQNENVGHRPHPWVRFLVKLFIAVIILCWLAVWLHQLRLEHLALFQLALGGYSEGWPPVLDRLDGHIVELRLSKIADDDLNVLEQFTKLHTLDLAASRKMPVEISPGRIELVLVPVQENRLTDSGLTHLERLTNLDGLSLRDTQVTDAGLQHLRLLARLRVLNLEGCRITGEGLAHLENLERLDSLLLSRSTISDEGLAHLARFPRLAHVSLSDTQISDAGLIHLQRVSTLEAVELANTKVTDEGVRMLQHALPNCKIVRDGKR
jgi:hypothetical protein